jgi:hypothetical protein
MGYGTCLRLHVMFFMRVGCNSSREGISFEVGAQDRNTVLLNLYFASIWWSSCEYMNI